MTSMGKNILIYAFVAISGLIFLMAVTHRQTVEASERYEPKKLFHYQGAAVYVVTDPETGCEYLMVKQYKGSGITPRLIDGKPYCGE